MFVLLLCCYSNEGINYSQTQLLNNIYVAQLILQNNGRRKERAVKSREKLKSVTQISTVTCETRYMDIQKGMTRIILLLPSNLSSDRGGQYRDCSTDSNTECGKGPCPYVVSWNERTKQRFIFKELCIGDASLQRYGPSNWVWLGWKSSKTTKVFWKKDVFRANLERMFKRTATALDTQPTTSQQRLMFALKNARLLPDGCCCLSNTDNKALHNQLASYKSRL